MRTSAVADVQGVCTRDAGRVGGGLGGCRLDSGVRRIASAVRVSKIVVVRELALGRGVGDVGGVSQPTPSLLGAVSQPPPANRRHVCQGLPPTHPPIHAPIHALMLI